MIAALDDERFGVVASAKPEHAGERCEARDRHEEQGRHRREVADEVGPHDKARRDERHDHAERRPGEHALKPARSRLEIARRLDASQPAPCIASVTTPSTPPSTANGFSISANEPWKSPSASSGTPRSTLPIATPKSSASSSDERREHDVPGLLPQVVVDLMAELDARARAG